MAGIGTVELWNEKGYDLVVLAYRVVVACESLLRQVRILHLANQLEIRSLPL